MNKKFYGYQRPKGTAILEIPKAYKPQIERYINAEVERRLREQQYRLVVREMKLVAQGLHELYGFGAIRLERLFRKVNEDSLNMEQDSTGWMKVDRLLIDELGIKADREDYDAIENAWLSRHRGDRTVMTLEEEQE